MLVAVARVVGDWATKDGDGDGDEDYSESFIALVSGGGRAVATGGAVRCYAMLCYRVTL